GSMTRAKLDMLKSHLEFTTKLVHTVDTRKVWDLPLPMHFLGVGACGARCETLQIKDIVATGNLAKVMTTVQASINALTPQFLIGLLQWVTGQGNKRWLEINMNSFLSIDLGATSWQGMMVYRKQGFGFRF